jgi:hypothetical protein
MKTFKRYACNRAKLEASMVEGYILYETIGFVTKYMRELVHIR